ncbi:hypothetical protein BY996DRAFT_6584298 [Phakopsora pachyrhizi]|nr:hypothetical protein BY996DRAFT_6584298 [Phakopsora pachyrhizi]
MTTPGDEEVRRPTNKNKRGVICGQKIILESVSGWSSWWLEEARTDRLDYDLGGWEPVEYEYLKVYPAVNSESKISEYTEDGDLIRSELDNIRCVEITTESGVDISTEIEKKGYHFIVRYLSEEVLGYLANFIKTEDKGKRKHCLELVKEQVCWQQYSCQKSTGLNMDSECLSLLILQKSPRNYDSIEQVLKKLEKDQLQFNNKNKNVEALYVKKPYKKKFEKFNKFNKEKRIKCHNCNKLGHLAKDSNFASHEDEYETEVTSLMANKEIINDNMVIDKETDSFKISPEPSEKENMNLIDYGYEAYVSNLNSNITKNNVQMINYGLFLKTDRGTS